jgi:hypothetical protein
MSRLITLGCSHTIGDGLKNPPIGSWPSVLSNRLGLEVINLAESGGSNRTIQHKVYTFEFKEDDIVIILWTYPDRYHFFESKYTNTGCINSWGTNDVANAWFKYFHTSYNEKFDNQTIVNQVNLFLKDARIKVYNLLVSSEFDYYFDITAALRIDIDFTEKYLNKYPRGIDGWHMGELGNHDFAMDIYYNITRDKGRPEGLI